MAPDTGGDKAYALLFDGLKKTGYVGIARLTKSNREHVIAIRAAKTGLAVHTLFYPNEARAADEFQTDTGSLNKKESQMAVHLIEALAAEFDHTQYKGEYMESVLALIESKKSGKEAPKAAAAKPKPPARDIMAALEASIEGAKKKAAGSSKKRKVA